MVLIYSAPGIASNQIIRAEDIEAISQNYSEYCIMMTTQFGLPFNNINEEKRQEWFKYRLNIFKKYTLKSMKKQLLNASIKTIYWIIYISKGDRKRFNLRKVECINESIIIIWHEIERVKCASDDFYRNNILPKTIQEYWRVHRRIFVGCKKLITMRLDSDDILNKYYIQLGLYIATKHMSSNESNCIYINFPCGSMYDIKEKSLKPYIWPESSFFICGENEGNEINTVWKHGHDIVAKKEELITVTTNRPMWTIIVGHGNMANKSDDYLEDIEI